MIELRGATASHVGNVRESNQDRVHFAGYTGVVADGMGGHQGGEMAASIAISEFVHIVDPIAPGGLAELVENANKAVFEKAADPELRGMGTTLVALTLRPDEQSISIVNVGDSRAYHLRDGSLKQLTLDHSLVEDLVRQQRLTPEEAQNHPQRNILTRALGIASQVEVDRFIKEVEVGDRFLLCSDGLFNEVAEDDIAAILLANPEPDEAANILVEAALSAAGRDNISVAVIDVVPQGHGGDLSSGEAETLLVPATPVDVGAGDGANPDLEVAAAGPAVGVDLADPDAETGVERYGDEYHVDHVASDEAGAVLDDPRAGEARNGLDHPTGRDGLAAGPGVTVDGIAPTTELPTVPEAGRSHLFRNAVAALVVLALLAAGAYFGLGIGQAGEFLVRVNDDDQLAFFQEPRFPWGGDAELETSSLDPTAVNPDDLASLSDQRFGSLEEAKEAVAELVAEDDLATDVGDGLTQENPDDTTLTTQTTENGPEPAEEPASSPSGNDGTDSGQRPGDDENVPGQSTGTPADDESEPGSPSTEPSNEG